MKGRLLIYSDERPERRDARNVASDGVLVLGLAPVAMDCGVYSRFCWPSSGDTVLKDDSLAARKC